MTMEESPQVEDHSYVLKTNTGTTVSVVTEHVRHLAEERWAEEQYQYLARIDRESEEVRPGTPSDWGEDWGERQTREDVQYDPEAMEGETQSQSSPPAYETGLIPVSSLFVSLSQNSVFLSEEDVVASLDQYERDLLRNLRTLLPPTIIERSTSPVFPGREFSMNINNMPNSNEEPEESLSPVPTTRHLSNPLLHQPPPIQLDQDDPPVTCTFGIMDHSDKLSFVSQDFRPYEDIKFNDSFNKKVIDSTGLIFLVITNWQPWFLMDLTTAIPNFPAQPVLHLSNNRGTTMLPLVDRSLCEMSCVMEHIDTTTSDHQASHNVLRVGSSRIICRPLVVWTGATQKYPRRPLIVVVSGSSDETVSKIANHYIQVSRRAVKHERWNRLRANQIWIYLDLCFLFTHWENVWGTVKQNLHFQTQEVLERKNVLSILDQTRQLHTDNNVMISLREHLRIHKASIKVVIQRTRQEPDGQSLWQSNNALRDRLDDASELLEYYDVTATSLLEHQQNLLSLAFNLETVIQGQAVARLNALAFIFLPLSFVAGVFGITTFKAPPYWYPVAAVPTLLLTIGVAYISNWLFSLKTQPNSGIPAETDIEKHLENKVKSNPNSIYYSWKSMTGSLWNLYQQNLSQISKPKSTPSPLVQRFPEPAPQYRQYVPDSRPSQMSYAQMIPSAGPPRPARTARHSLNIFATRQRLKFPASVSDNMMSTQSMRPDVLFEGVSDSSLRMDVPYTYGSYTGIQTPLSAPSPYSVVPRAGPPEPQNAPPPTQLTRPSTMLRPNPNITFTPDTTQYTPYRPYATVANTSLSHAGSIYQALPTSVPLGEDIQLELLTRRTQRSLESESLNVPAGEIRVVANEISTEEAVPILETILE